MTVLLDMEKAYETVGHTLMWHIGLSWRMPVQMLKLILECFGLPRIVRLGEACAAPRGTKFGILAGSRYGTRFMKLIMVLLCDLLHGKWPWLGRTLFADDLGLRVRGTARWAARIMTQAMQWLIQFAEEVFWASLCPGASEARVNGLAPPRRSADSSSTAWTRWGSGRAGQPDGWASTFSQEAAEGAGPSEKRA